MKIQSPSYVEERDGELYAGDTRVTVTSIVTDWTVHHQAPEGIHEDFPTVPLATIYGVIAYYLDHQQEIDERIAQNEAIFKKMMQVQRDDPNDITNIVRRRIEEARKQNEGQDESHP